MAVAGMLFTACNGKKNRRTRTRSHRWNASTRRWCSAYQITKTDSVAQEEFTVGKDSTATKEAHDHQHENGEKHDH